MKFNLFYKVTGELKTLKDGERIEELRYKRA